MLEVGSDVLPAAPYRAAKSRLPIAPGMAAASLVMNGHLRSEILSFPNIAALMSMKPANIETVLMTIGQKK